METFAIKNCAIVKQTPNAILVESDELDESLWVPQSQVSDDSEIWQEGESGTLLITEWFAKKSGLTED